jgi:predicted transcriptional regulator
MKTLHKIKVGSPVGLRLNSRRTTLSYMPPKKTSKKTIKKTAAKRSAKSPVKASAKSASLTIRIDPQTARLLDELGREANKSRSEIARDALRRQLRLARFESVRKRLMPYAEAQGILTDEDVFAIVS